MMRKSCSSVECEERIWIAKYRRKRRLVRERPKTPLNTNEHKRRKRIANRTRQNAYIFRANDDEKKLIDEKMAQSGLTMTEFIIRTITNKKIVAVQHASEMLAELKRQGNNLNQTVRNNYYGVETERELNDCITELKKTYRRMIEAIGGSDAVT